jgi:membrane protease YdiL (CAAX protease family)
MSGTPDLALAPPPHPPRREPERDDGGFPRWPLFAPVAALFLGLAVGVVVAGMLGAILQSSDPTIKSDSPWLTSLTSFAVDVCVVGASFGIASLTTVPARPWQFGLRRAPLVAAAGTALLAVIGFFLFEGIYSAVVNPHNPQTIVQDLGANTSTTLLVTGAVVVIVVAPICEETFFRGFLYRVLRLRMGFLLAASIDGLIFGAVHGSLVILPVLAVLGFALCWVYERTGSILPTIAIHAVNNTLAYGSMTHHGWAAAGAAGGVMLAGCAVCLLTLPRGTLAPRHAASV